MSVYNAGVVGSLLFVTCLAESLFAGVFDDADRLFDKREGSAANVRAAREKYRQALHKAGKLSEKAYAIQQLGRLADFESLYLLREDQRFEKARLYNELRSTTSILAADDNLVHWYAHWLMHSTYEYIQYGGYRERLSSALVLRTIMHQLIDTDNWEIISSYRISTSYQAGGLNRTLARIYADARTMRDVGMDPPDIAKAIDFGRRAIMSRPWPNTSYFGFDNYANHRALAEIHLAARDPDSAREVVEYAIEDIEERIADNDLPAGYEPETRGELVLLRKMLKRFRLKGKHVGDAGINVKHFLAAAKTTRDQGDDPGDREIDAGFDRAKVATKSTQRKYLREIKGFRFGRKLRHELKASVGHHRPLTFDEAMDHLHTNDSDAAEFGTNLRFVAVSYNLDGSLNTDFNSDDPRPGVLIHDEDGRFDTSAFTIDHFRRGHDIYTCGNLARNGAIIKIKGTGLDYTFGTSGFAIAPEAYASWDATSYLGPKNVGVGYSLLAASVRTTRPSSYFSKLSLVQFAGGGLDSRATDTNIGNIPQWGDTPLFINNTDRIYIAGTQHIEDERIPFLVAFNDRLERDRRFKGIGRNNRISRKSINLVDFDATRMLLLGNHIQYPDNERGFVLSRVINGQLDRDWGENGVFSVPILGVEAKGFYPIYRNYICIIAKAYESKTNSRTALSAHFVSNIS